jgi:hypothetical protein
LFGDGRGSWSNAGQALLEEPEVVPGFSGGEGWAEQGFRTAYPQGNGLYPGFSPFPGHTDSHNTSYRPIDFTGSTPPGSSLAVVHRQVDPNHSMHPESFGHQGHDYGGRGNTNAYPVDRGVPSSKTRYCRSSVQAQPIIIS